VLITFSRRILAYLLLHPLSSSQIKTEEPVTRRWSSRLSNNLQQYADLTKVSKDNRRKTPGRQLFSLRGIGYADNSFQPRQQAEKRSTSQPKAGSREMFADRSSLALKVR
jgi:hypothetical protein